MSARYEALTTKVRAMYGKRMKYADYVSMAGMQSMDEVYGFLRQHPVWGPAVSRIREETLMTRSLLEGELREQIRREYARLTPYFPQKDKELMSFPVLRSELGGLLFTLTRLQAGQTKTVDALPNRFILQSKVDEHALVTCRDYDELTESMRGTIYYDAMVNLRPEDGGLPNYSVAEALLYSVYYKYMLDVAKNRYEGDVRKILQQTLGSQVDLLNMMHILRLKNFFPDTDDIYAVLFPFNYKLKPEHIRAMCNAEGYEGVLEIIADTPYAKTFRNASVSDLQRIYDETLFRLSRRQLMMGKPTIYSTVAFLNLRMLEMKELITVVETVKYRADYDDRFARVLGS